MFNAICRKMCKIKAYLTALTQTNPNKKQYKDTQTIVKSLILTISNKSNWNIRRAKLIKKA